MSRMCYSSKTCVHSQAVTHTSIVSSARVSCWLTTEAGTGCSGGRRSVANYLKDLQRIYWLPF